MVLDQHLIEVAWVELESIDSFTAANLFAGQSPGKPITINDLSRLQTY